MSRSLKNRTAHSLKWNIVDRVASQCLYAVTGIVLARVLSEEDFGLVGAMLIFQAFASLMVDSGFSYALLQRKKPSRLDYSTVLWFNMGMAVLLYAVLFVAAPLIAKCFQNDARIIPLSRVQFLVIILNASAIVHTNRLMKGMQMRMVAVSNTIGLVLGGVTGIVLALTGFGAWAIVWQAIVLAACKTMILWTSSSWRPLARFSLPVLRSYFGIGLKMMFTSFLNTLFLNIYGFFIGNRVGLVALGYYTQSDKWSKMGITSVSQVLTSTFLPALSAVQDVPERFAAVVSKTNRFTAYILFPFLLGLAAVASPMFHTLFGTKWDPSIILFQLLLFRGVFTVLVSLYNNYLLALGHSGTILKLEVLRDTVALIALVVSLPFINLTQPDNPVWGLEILLYGQLAASVITWVATLWETVRLTKVPLMSFMRDMSPYLAQTLLIIPVMLAVGALVPQSALKLVVELVVALGLYIGGNRFFGSTLQREVFAYFRYGKVPQ
ncbi:MAG: lipopolysaccharide biosynthesis protein [Muribaculaceae bacterium]|nr:lipopolysaccharide biosynthesis protein [Muribaculaceae bacterium]